VAPRRRMAGGTKPRMAAAEHSGGYARSAALFGTLTVLVTTAVPRLLGGGLAASGWDLAALHVLMPPPLRSSGSPAPAPPIMGDRPGASATRCDAEALLSWLRAHGARLHPALEVHPARKRGEQTARSASSSGGRAGIEQVVAHKPQLGVFAAGPIAAGATLFSVPDNVSLSARASGVAPLPLPEGGLASSFIGNASTTRAYAALATALLHERSLGERSRYAHYLACLPPLWGCPTLPCFSERERAELADPFAAAAAATDRATLLRLRGAIDWGAVMGPQQRPLSGAPWPPPTEQEWLWAVGMAISRAFSVGGVPRLLPFVDLLNHHPEAGPIRIHTARASEGRGAPDSSDTGVMMWEKVASASGVRAGDQVGARARMHHTILFTHV
jgi:hypothetical protein